MGNEDVLRLFDMYADDAFRLAYSYLGSRPEAEDVVQDVFVKLIRSDIKITKGKEKTYLLTMTAIQFIHGLRVQMIPSRLTTRSHTIRIPVSLRFSQKHPAVSADIYNSNSTERVSHISEAPFLHRDLFRKQVL